MEHFEVEKLKKKGSDFVGIFTNYRKLYNQAKVKLYVLENKAQAQRTKMLEITKENANLSLENQTLISQSIKDDLEKKRLEEKRRKNASAKGGLMKRNINLVTELSKLKEQLKEYRVIVKQLNNEKTIKLEIIDNLKTEIMNLKTEVNTLTKEKISMNKIIEELNKKNALLKHPVKIEELRKYQTLRKSRKKEEE